MPWKVITMVEARRELVDLALKGDVSVTELSVRFGVSRKTAYKWLKRFAKEGVGGMQDRSRRPEHTPGRTSGEVEAQVISLRGAHPAWGGRKLRRRLMDQGVSGVPAASTITEILRRGKLLSKPSSPHQYKRFERSEPNELWQMDFKGHFELGGGGRCHPLAVLDDHSRYSIVLQACGDERRETVEGLLQGAFRRYGLPEQMLMDNGPPWGDSGASSWTMLTVWLLRLGVKVSHGRPYHPQTQGKEERFNRTLKAEVLQGSVLLDLRASQERFDGWRTIYNYERPHEALELAVPASRYRASVRSYPERLPEMEFSPIDEVRKVAQKGWISFRGREWGVGQAFTGQRVGVRPTTRDGVWEIWFGPQCLGEINQQAEAECRRMVRRPQGESESAVVGGGTDSVRSAHCVRSSPNDS